MPLFPEHGFWAGPFFGINQHVRDMGNICSACVWEPLGICIYIYIDGLGLYTHGFWVTITDPLPIGRSLGSKMIKKTPIFQVESPQRKMNFEWTGTPLSKKNGHGQNESAATSSYRWQNWNVHCRIFAKGRLGISNVPQLWYVSDRFCFLTLLKTIDSILDQMVHQVPHLLSNCKASALGKPPMPCQDTPALVFLGVDVFRF